MRHDRPGTSPGRHRGERPTRTGPRLGQLLPAGALVIATTGVVAAAVVPSSDRADEQQPPSRPDSSTLTPHSTGPQPVVSGGTIITPTAFLAPGRHRGTPVAENHATPRAGAEVVARHRATDVRRPPKAAHPSAAEATATTPTASAAPDTPVPPTVPAAGPAGVPAAAPSGDSLVGGLLGTVDGVLGGGAGG